MGITKLKRKEGTCEDGLLIKEIISRKSVSTVFQPIVDLNDASIFGVEALSRGPEGTRFYSPLPLFKESERLGLLYPIESLARETAIRSFRKLSYHSKLFLNLTPTVVNEPGFAKGQTRRLVKHLGLNAHQIVFEITERSSIKDFSSFKKALEHYREQGFLVAVDDAGAGYSSLQSIAELQPDYIKLDMSLIQGVENNYTKKVLLETFVTLAGKIGSALIAEGIETEKQLTVIKNLGIQFGQGFYLARPSPAPEIEDSVMVKLKKSTPSKRNRFLLPLIAQVPVVSGYAKMNEIPDLLMDHEYLITADNNMPTGVISRQAFLRFSGTFSRDLLGELPVQCLVKASPVITTEMDLKTICRAVLSQVSLNLKDALIVMDKTSTIGVIPLHLLLSEYLNQSKCTLENDKIL